MQAGARFFLKQSEDSYKLYYFEGRNTGIAARSEREAREKKRRGGDKLVAVRTPNDSEKRDMAAGRWVRTRRDGKPPSKSQYGKGRGYGPPRKKSASALASKFFATKRLFNKLAIDRAADTRREFLADRKYGFGYLTGEAKELGEALLSGKLSDINEEWQDTSFAAQQLLSQVTGTNLPLIGTGGSVKKFRDRINRWREEYEQHGVPFSVDHLKGGSNYAKYPKVLSALQIAGAPQHATSMWARLNTPELPAIEELWQQGIPEASRDLEFRQQDLAEKTEDLRNNGGKKELADVLMSARWAELAGDEGALARTHQWLRENAPEQGWPDAEEALQERIKQLQKSLRSNGTPGEKRGAAYIIKNFC